MRFAEINGRVQTLRARAADKGPRLTGLSVGKLSGFQNIEVKLDNAFLAICGGTGTGKSTLLQSIYAGLKPLESGADDFQRGRISGFSVTVTVEGPSGTWNEHRDFGKPTEPSDGYSDRVFLDSIDDRADISRRAAIGDAEALKEGVEPFKLDDDALAFLKLICRKDYSEVLVYETSLQGDKYYPHFEVTEGGVSYSSEEMGSGEHSAFYLSWRLSTAPANAIVLLEEPEALLPPASHSQMCAMISTFAQKRNLLPIFTTHSTGIVEFLGDGDVISLSRIDGNTLMPTSTEAKAKVLAKLGLLARKPILALVEDSVGHSVLEELLDAYGFSEVLDIAIVVVQDGAGGIKTLLEMLSPDHPVESVFGFLDGDMKGNAGGWPCKDRLLFLPITDAPEIDMIAAIEKDPSSFAAASNRPDGQVLRVLERTGGEDHHDRFRAIAKQLGFDEATFTKLGLNHLLKMAGEDQAKLFAQELARKMRVSPPDLD